MKEGAFLKGTAETTVQETLELSLELQDKALADLESAAADLLGVLDVAEPPREEEAKTREARSGRVGRRMDSLERDRSRIRHLCGVLQAVNCEVRRL